MLFLSPGVCHIDGFERERECGPCVSLQPKVIYVLTMGTHGGGAPETAEQDLSCSLLLEEGRPDQPPVPAATGLRRPAPGLSNDALRAWRTAIRSFGTVGGLLFFLYVVKVEILRSHTVKQVLVGALHALLSFTVPAAAAYVFTIEFDRILKEEDDMDLEVDT